MSWLDEAIPILRVLTGDDYPQYTYCDTRLADVLAAVAKLLVLELSFDIDYTVTVSTSTIDPDPEADPFFIPLLVLLAATKIASSEYKAASSSAGSITDGPSTISLAGVATALKVRMDSIQKDYDKAKMQYILGNAIGCQAVLSVCERIYSTCYIDRCFDYNRYREYIY